MRGYCLTGQRMILTEEWEEETFVEERSAMYVGLLVVGVERGID